jgi:hypothetical protein
LPVDPPTARRRSPTVAADHRTALAEYQAKLAELKEYL